MSLTFTVSIGYPNKDLLGGEVIVGEQTTHCLQIIDRLFFEYNKRRRSDHLFS